MHIFLPFSTDLNGSALRNDNSARVATTRHPSRVPIWGNYLEHDAWFERTDRAGQFRSPRVRRIKRL